jgi:type II restriction/modification system DNA methylase subunit YeeA
VDYIVRNSLGKYLEEQFEAIEKKHLKNEKQMKDKTYDAKQQALYIEYQKVLSEVKVLDPACGSGAFLVKVFDYLLEENVRVMEVLSA